MVTDVDAVFVQGHDHKVCQDYATCRRLLHKAALSDGCSRVVDSYGRDIEADTDVGARLLTTAAMNCYPRNAEALTMVVEGYIRLMNIPRTSLMATLGVVWADGDNISVRLFGDGLVLYQAVSGEWYVHKLSFNGDPSYPLSRTSSSYTAERLQPQPNEPMEVGYPYFMEFDVGHVKTVAIMSDGAFAFRTATAAVGLPPELLDISSTRGKWCQRHIQGTIRQLAAKGVYPSDDVSMVGVAIR